MKKIITNIKDLFRVERHRLIVSDTTLIGVLKKLAINSKRNSIGVSSYGFIGDENHLWSVSFCTRKSVWKKLKNELHVLRIWDISDIASDNVDGVFSTD